jgi:hypothetical protein
MVIKAQGNGLITGLVEHIIPNRVAILHYVDDTIICLEHDWKMLEINMKMLLLYVYDMIFGLKINFNKSEILMLKDKF